MNHQLLHCAIHWRSCQSCSSGGRFWSDQPYSRRPAPCSTVTPHETTRFPWRQS